MKLKNSSPLLNAKQLKKTLFSHKLNGIKKDIIIPDELIFEIEDFSLRNSLVNSPSITCCRCLKAHALKQAKEKGLSKSAVEFLGEVFDCTEGHNGYYLDKGRLVKI